tara:strand:+ start:308 stop:1360 length:1053 start_codon:yes stop_codon:yes gene_type:complete
MKTILVTGGTGFIGSHTCISLLEKGYRVIVFDSLINSSLECINRIKKIIRIDREKDKENSLIFIKGDLREINSIEEVFKKAEILNFQIEAVIHFAGLKSVSDSIKNPIDYWDNNLKGTINLVKIMDKYKCNKLIFSSSATIYASNSCEIYSEESKVNPNNPYGQTKLSIEKMLKDLCLRDSSYWKIACLRYFNPIGAHPSGIIGESPVGYSTNIFPIINKVASGILKKIEIFGNNYPTKDGTGIRDYIHVVDLAEGHIAALNYIREFEAKFIVINLGTGIGTTVLELIKVYEKVNKCKIPYVFTNRREGDLASVIANNKLAIKLLNWKPRNNLYDMCRDGWNWQKNNPFG